MNFKIKILKKLREQLALEELSRDTYYAFLKKIDNKKINSDIAGIYNQEIEHIKIVNEMVDILSKYKIPIKETKKEIKERRETNLTLKGEIILFTDSDCIPDKSWIRNIVNRFENDVGCFFKICLFIVLLRKDLPSVSKYVII